MNVVAECEEAVRLLQKELSIEFLGELDSETFEQYQALIGDPALIKRARHAVTENERTLLAKQALTEGFGRIWLIIKCLTSFAKRRLRSNWH